MDQITGIIVSYNTKNLLKNCVESIRKFYPTLNLIIIDGSNPDNDCYHYSKSIVDTYTKVFNVEYNIGHGKGMKMAIDMCKTDYFVLIDSDTVMLKGNIIEILLFGITHNNAYGAGLVVNTNKNGSNYSGTNSIRYLHPYFCVISLKKYREYSPVIHHGAPMINAMIDISGKENIIHFNNMNDYILHVGRGTRLLDPKEFKPGTWESVN